MNPNAEAFVKYVVSDMPTHDKQRAITETQKAFGLIKDGKVYYCDAFAVRFCYSKNRHFSNTVLALSKLQKYDGIPFFVVLIRHDLGNALYLANSSMLKKISHSSKGLSLNNIKGSFNGSDIIKEYSDTLNGAHTIPNDYEHVRELFAIHQGFTWEENMERLVESTSLIHPQKEKFLPIAEQEENLYNSVKRAIQFVESEDFVTLRQDLDNRVRCRIDLILIASHIENTNIRGRLIEHLITSDETSLPEDFISMEKCLPIYDTKNGLGDYVRRFSTYTTYTDVKTKILYLDSNPKAYNVDKFLQCMSAEDSVFMIYMVGIGEKGLVNCALCSIYDQRILNCTVFQDHWSGRGTRGEAQFKGKALHEILQDENFRNDIDEAAGKRFLGMLLNR